MIVVGLLWSNQSLIQLNLINFTDQVIQIQFDSYIRKIKFFSRLNYVMN